MVADSFVGRDICDRRSFRRQECVGLSFGLLSYSILVLSCLIRLVKFVKMCRTRAVRCSVASQFSIAMVKLDADRMLYCSMDFLGPRLLTSLQKFDLKTERV